MRCGAARSIRLGDSGVEKLPTAAEPLKPAVPIKKSVTDDYIISLEDGRKLKSMKRYLSGLGMTPAEALRAAPANSGKFN